MLKNKKRFQWQGAVMKRLFLLFLVSIVAVNIEARSTLLDHVNFSNSQHITILGSVRCAFPESLLGLPVLYKGGEYDLNRKGDFELYENQKPSSIFVIFTEYLEIPDENNIAHLKTSPNHPYLYYKLTKTIKEVVDTNRLDLIKNRAMIEVTETWDIEKLDATEKMLEIPDNTVIIFLDPDLVDHLEEVVWSAATTGLRLPTVVLKDNVKEQVLADLAVRMKLAFLDFRFMHKKPYKAYMPCGNNHILSMPFRPRGYC